LTKLLLRFSSAPRESAFDCHPHPSFHQLAPYRFRKTNAVSTNIGRHFLTVQALPAHNKLNYKTSSYPLLFCRFHHITTICALSELHALVSHPADQAFDQEFLIHKFHPPSIFSGEPAFSLFLIHIIIKIIIHFSSTTMANSTDANFTVSTYRPMRLSGPVPSEVWACISSHLDRNSLKAVIKANCATSFEAERLYWQNMEGIKGLLNELDHQPECRRQALAAHVLNINMDFQASSTDEEGSGLHFPLLQHLTVEHHHGLDCEQTRLYARMKHLVGPMLRKLNVAYVKHFISNIQPSVGNFLPTLATSTKLRVLQISAHVDGATSGDLTAALKRCQKLEVVHLGKYTGLWEPSPDTQQLRISTWRSGLMGP
jgi:hypothetical protein